MERKRKLVDVYAGGLRTSAADLAVEHGVTATTRILGTVTVDFVRYWTEKASDPTFHPESHGGRRRLAHGTEGRQALIEWYVWLLMKEDPMRTCAQYVAALERVGVATNVTWIKRLVLRWGLTWKKPMHKQINKFTAENIAYYAQYVVTIRSFPIHRLKYCDESHFESRSLRRARGLAPAGQELIAVSGQSISESYSVTVMTTLQNPDQPLVLSNFRVSSNSAVDFLEWVIRLIEQQHLVAGDVLVCDNASVHIAREIVEPLTAALDAAGVRLILLPTYSPELNPCELVFGQVKSYLRRCRTDNPFWMEIVTAFAQVDVTNVLLYYVKCLRI